MMVRRFAGDRWWGGYTIRLEEGGDGWHYALRRNSFPGDARRPASWQYGAGPFQTEDGVYEAALARIMGLDARRRGGGTPLH